MKLALSFLLIYILSEIHGEEEEKFVCAKPGRYENPTDETCNSFYLCSYSLKGELIQTQYSCPEKSIFSPSTATCSKNYTCPRVSRSIRDLVQIEAINNIHYHCKEERIDHYECRRSGRYADLVGTTCKKYYLCSLLESGTYVKTLFECPEGSFFNPRTQKCHVNYECPCHQKLNENNWISSGDSSRQEERHEEIGWAERLEWTELFKRWTEHYRWTEIPQRRSTREPTEASTLRASTESCIDKDDAKPFVCKEEGKFPDRKDVTCTDYYFCSKLLNGGFVKTKLSCTYGSTFNPYLKKCSMRYECPCQFDTVSTYQTIRSTAPTNYETFTSTERVHTTEPSPTPLDCQIPNTEFICTRKGRYPDRRDSSCNTYFHCENNKNGKLIRKRYRCPRCLTFNPSTEKCTDNYLCPCSFTEAPGKTSKATTNTPSKQPNTGETSSSKTKSTTTSKSPTTGSTSRTPENSISTTERSGSSSTRKGTRTTNDCIIPPTTKTFKCSTKGRFANKWDLTCTSYFLCSALNNGTLLKTKYRCPKNSAFDPSLRRCSNLYECPCANTPVTTSKLSSSTTSRTTGKSSSTSSGKPSDSTENTEITADNTKTSGHPSSTLKPTRKTHTPPSSVSTEGISTSSSGLTESTGKSSSSGGSSSTSHTGKTQKTSSKSPSTGGSTSGKPDGSKSTTEKTGSSSTSSESKTTNDCIIPPSNKPFKCSRKGRFPNKKDLTCTTYFLCSALNNGTLLKTQYRCPRNSAFDPSLRRCSNLYECPCTNTPVTTPKLSSSTTSRSTGKSSSTSSGTPTDSTENTEITEENTKTSRRTSSTLKPTRKTQTPPSSVSTERISTSSSGLTESTGKSSSPGGSSSTSHTDKTQKTSSKSPSTGGSTSRKPDGSKSTTEKTGSSSTSSETKTTNDCIIPPFNKPFKCSRKGRFPNKRDLTCTSYFLCSALNNGTLLKTQYRCPRNSAFDPSLRRCSNLYECPCAHIPSMSPIYSSTTTSRTSGNSTSSKSVAPSSTTTESSQAVSSTARSTEKSYTSTSTHSSSENSEPTHSTCIDPPSTYKFVCETRGRFADIRDRSCSYYFLCSLLPDGTIVQARYRCNKGLKFNPIKQNCSPFYDCPCDIITTSPTTSRSSTVSTVLPDICQPVREEFVCTSVGRFPKPGDVSCCTYYSCTKSSNGTIAQTEFSCPEGSSFDPVFRVCSDSYQCPCHVTESPEYLSTSSDDCVVPTEEFICTSPGRFPNRQDVSCCNYFLCNDAGNGTFAKIEYNCPMGKSFDPELKRCSSSYVCPCRITENPLSSTIERTSPTTTSPAVVTNRTTDFTQPPECDISPSNPEHVCTQRGRFRDNKDITCSNYFLCSRLRSGLFIRTQYSCPRFSFFNPLIGLCTTSYKCPCINTFSTPSRSTGRITKIPGTRAPWHINTKKTTPATTPRQCIPLNPSIGEFVCSEQGKFLNPFDTKCTSYVHCLRKNSVLVKTVVNCEGMTAFDVKLQKCTKNAICEVCK